VQSERGAPYDAALVRLAEAGRLFPCRRSRKDLAALATAPHGREGLPPYPAAFRPPALAPGWFAKYQSAARPDAALRFRVEDGDIAFADRVQGLVTDDVATTTGDFVLKRRDGVYAYQLAVVVDDLAMGITEVVRGADLLDSTARQIQLIEALGGTRPSYAHLPLVVDETGEKLSKRHGALTLAALRDGGIRPEAVVGWLGYVLGQSETPRPVAAQELVARFAWERVHPLPVVVTADLEASLRAASS
jgi:glutamyl-tRNA synthetase